LRASFPPHIRPLPALAARYQRVRQLTRQLCEPLATEDYVAQTTPCFTSAGHMRPSYRNFFPAYTRWQMSGIRLARDEG
jgi:formylglycine-generating enzyme required for sulfatase activity